MTTIPSSSSTAISDLIDHTDVFKDTGHAATTSSASFTMKDITQQLPSSEPSQLVVASATSSPAKAAAAASLDQQQRMIMEPHRYYILIEFAVRHLDFQMAELVSVLNMHHIHVVTTTTPQVVTAVDDSYHSCTLIPLPNDDTYPSHVYKTYSTTQQQQRNDCSIDSTRPFAILSMGWNSPFVPHDAWTNDTRNNYFKRNGHINRISKHYTNNNSNNSNEDIASIILSRCTLVRSVIELWGMGTSIEECATITQQQCCCSMDIERSNDLHCMSTPLASISTNNLRQVLYQNHSVDSKSWKMTIHTLGSTYTRAEQDTMRHSFTHAVPFHGTVQMNHPYNEYIAIREIELDRNGGPKLQQQQSSDSNNNNNNGQYPSIGCYFGRVLTVSTCAATGSGSGGRNVHRMNGDISKYDLKQRKYLGPTSMDAELSFIMTNLGHVQKGQYAFDPFVGTGSILLSCAIRGAFCIGTDIDIRVLRGRDTDVNIFSNFQQFNLPRPELIRSDNHIYHRHFQQQQPIYDAIVCDPPYGIRAGARKSGSKRDVVSEVKPENRHDHIAQTQSYPVSDVLADLVDVAARTLVMDGRLVYVIPSFATSFDVDVDLPQHPCLELVHVCYQPLSSELGRRIVAMKKVLNYDATKRDEYLATVWTNGPESADKCANIRTKIIEMAKTKPRYEERAAIRKEKRRVHRDEKNVAKKRAIV